MQLAGLTFSSGEGGLFHAVKHADGGFPGSLACDMEAGCVDLNVDLDADLGVDPDGNLDVRRVRVFARVLEQVRRAAPRSRSVVDFVFYTIYDVAKLELWRRTACVEQTGCGVFT